jgi:Right handed beta helix region
VMLVSGGAPALEDLVLKFSGYPSLGATLAGGLFVEDRSDATINDSQIWNRVRIAGGSAPTFRGGRFEDARIAIQDGSAPLIADADVFGDCSGGQISVVGGSSATFRHSAFTDIEFHIEGGPDLHTQAVIEDNRIAAAGSVAVSISDGANASIERNSFVGSLQAVRVSHASAMVRDNKFVSDVNAITLSDADAVVTGNTVRFGDYALSVVSSGAPVISRNVIESATTRGILVGSGTSPTIDGNTVCGSAVNLYIDPAADPVIGHNDICPDRVAGTG